MASSFLMHRGKLADMENMNLAAKDQARELKKRTQVLGCFISSVHPVTEEPCYGSPLGLGIDARNVSVQREKK
jgi:hypothetical protein